MLIDITIMLTGVAIVLASLYVKLKVGTVELWSCDSYSNYRYIQAGTKRNLQQQPRRRQANNTQKQRKGKTEIKQNILYNLNTW